uniref:CCHC-type domain-containing protein n=1 Tax=Panagrellus redivivus TaxID=6233 RepID=A0A7E4VDP0_PANRE
MASVSEYCVFCSNRHSEVDCRTYPTINCRQYRLNELRRCYRCLKTGHIPPQCVKYVGCGICGLNSHHTALCCKNELIKDVEAFRLKDEWCVFCQKHPNSSDCHKIRTHQMRTVHVYRNNLCQICLNRCHPNQPCEVDVTPCKFCGYMTHHKSLCQRNPHLDENYEIDPALGVCVFCGRHQQSVQCPMRDLQYRINILTAGGRCHKCLRHHSTESCDYRYRCRICRSYNHHSVICSIDASLTSAPVVQPFFNYGMYDANQYY